MNEVIDKQARNRNRRSLVILVLIFFMPMIVAWFVLKNIDTFKPSGTRNFGELIQPARPLTNFELQNADGSKLGLDKVKGKWSIFYFASAACDSVCQETLSKMHQARLAQGKEMHRLQSFYINVDTTTFSKETRDFVKPLTDIKLLYGEAVAVQNLLAQFKETSKQPDETGRIFLIDPHGNIMMTYDKSFVVRDLLKDLEHLLKYSQIG